MICTHGVSRTLLLLTNSCGHFICLDCSYNALAKWIEDPTVSRRDCPICRTILNENAPFLKPKIYSINNVLASNFYTWVPKRMPIRSNFSQDIIYHLETGNFTHAFKGCFLADLCPDDQHEATAPGFLQFYRDTYFHSKCTLCSANLSMDTAFVGKCGHFFCTMCSGFLMFGNRSTPGINTVICTKCDANLTESTPEFALIRPMAVTAKPEQDES